MSEFSFSAASVSHVLQQSSHRHLHTEKRSQHPVSLATLRRLASLGEPASALYVAIARTAASDVFFPGRVVFELGLVVTNGPSTFAFCRAGSTRSGPSPHLGSRRRCSQTRRTQRTFARTLPRSERVGPAQDQAARLSVERLKLAPLLRRGSVSLWQSCSEAPANGDTWSSEDSLRHDRRIPSAL